MKPDLSGHKRYGYNYPTDAASDPSHIAWPNTQTASWANGILCP